MEPINPRGKSIRFLKRERASTIQNPPKTWNKINSGMVNSKAILKTTSHDFVNRLPISRSFTWINEYINEEMIVSC